MRGKAGILAAMKVLWCNGRWLEADAFAVSPVDRGLMHGLGLFESLLAVDGVAPFLDRHLTRLAAAAGRLGWSLDLAGAAAAVAGLLERNGLQHGMARLRLTATGGEGALDAAARGGSALLWMIAAPVEPATAPLAVMVTPWRRNERSPLAGMKCAAYAENLLALQQARAAGFDEVLWFNTAGALCEAALANVFVVRDGMLRTPALDSGCLPGVTRALVLEWAAAEGVPCHEAVLSHEDLQLADEVFLTSAVQGPRPVCRVGERELAVGPVTARVGRAWRQAAGITGR